MEGAGPDIPADDRLDDRAVAPEQTGRDVVVRIEVGLAQHCSGDEVARGGLLVDEPELRAAQRREVMDAGIEPGDDDAAVSRDGLVGGDRGDQRFDPAFLLGLPGGVLTEHRGVRPPGAQGIERVGVAGRDDQIDGTPERLLQILPERPRLRVVVRPILADGGSEQERERALVGHGDGARL